VVEDIRKLGGALTKDHDRQAALGPQCCFPCCQWHQEIRPRLVGDSSHRIALAWRPRANQAQAGRHDTSMSQRQGSAIPAIPSELLYAGVRRCRLDSVTFRHCQSSSVVPCYQLSTCGRRAFLSPVCLSASTWNSLPDQLSDHQQ